MLDIQKLWKDLWIFPILGKKLTRYNPNYCDTIPSIRIIKILQFINYCWFSNL